MLGWISLVFFFAFLAPEVGGGGGASLSGAA
jgi:hypothetical protein